MPTFIPWKKSSKSKGVLSTSILDINCTNETIHVFPDSLSAHDIKIKYTTPTTLLRTPKHIYFTVHLLIKKEHQPELVDDLIKELLKRWRAITSLSIRNYASLYTTLKLCKKSALLKKFNSLNSYVHTL